MSKALVFNSSPRKDRGNTALILSPFLEGLRESGVEVELFYTRKLKINPCSSELDCWFGNAGRCYQDDDMNMLYPKLQQADIWIFATPLYVGGISGPMKNLIDRLIPLVQPFIELREGRCRHPLREGTKSGEIVLVSSCAFWEIESFDSVITQTVEICKHVNRRFAGALLRPHAHVLQRLSTSGNSADDIFVAAKQAGSQLARDGEMSLKTLKMVSRKLVSLEDYIQAANMAYQRMLDTNSHLGPSIQ